MDIDFLLVVTGMISLILLGNGLNIALGPTDALLISGGFLLLCTIIVATLRYLEGK